MKKFPSFGVLLLAASLVSCDVRRPASEETPSPTSSPTPAPEAFLTPTPVPSPAVTPEPLATATPPAPAGSPAETPAATPAPTVLPTEDLSITVLPGKRQVFGGLGTSLGNWKGEYQKLSPEERANLSQMFWKDLKFNTLRMWLNTYEYSPKRGARDLSNFKRNYVDSGIIADAKKNGVTILLLGPDGLPDYMKEKRKDGDVYLKDSEARNFAVLLADFINQLKKETGVELDATGIQNEPNGLDRFTPAQIVTVVKHLRTELNRHGLMKVKIVAPEQSSVDGVYYAQLAALKKDPAAWKALDAVSSHSYNMAATDEGASPIAGPDGGNLKEYWMTEASDNGTELPGDGRRAVSLAARFLNDVNHRVTHWIHFLGFEDSDPKDDSTRIIAYTANPKKMMVFQKYYAYQQLAYTFDVGAVFRDSESSLDRDMTWTFGKKPRVTASAASNPDGSWAVGLANYTADTFAGVQGWGDLKWNEEQGGHTPGVAYRVMVTIDELKEVGEVPFTVHRTNSTLQNAADPETVTMKDGMVEVNISPVELVTLRSVIK